MTTSNSFYLKSKVKKINRNELADSLWHDVIGNYPNKAHLFNNAQEELIDKVTSMLDEAEKIGKKPDSKMIIIRVTREWVANL